MGLRSRVAGGADSAVDVGRREMGSSGRKRKVREGCRGGMTARRCQVVGAMALLLLVVLDCCAKSVGAQRLQLVHRYAHLEGSSARRGEEGVSAEYHQTLVAHDRRRMRRMLAAVVTFPLTGDDDPFSTGLYYTQISLGTPPRQFYVQVDTGSDVLWVNCYPCTNCQRSNLGIKSSIYDPGQSSTSLELGCSDPECTVASQDASPSCSANSQCAYSTLYGDGSSTDGYFVSDVMTFDQPTSSTSTNSTGSAKVYFGCGNNQTGSFSVDGLIGLGQAQISVPSQLAAQNKVGKVFAHCLQGDNQGSGSLVFGTIRETNLSYTAIVPKQHHYNVELLNIAVNGANITTPASFEISTTGGGVIMDTGTTLAYLVQPAYTEFLNAVSNSAPVQPRNVPDSSGNTQICYIFSGSLSNFPDVTLFFAGGVEMTLGPQNYLYKLQLTSGSTAYCMGWLESSSHPGYQSYSIFGDIVLKDKLVVYDNDLQRIGWKNFDCTKGISVSSSANSTSFTVLPSQAGPPGAPGSSSSGAISSRTSTAPSLLWCLAFALSYSLL